jgi:hypothetical protein
VPTSLVACSPRAALAGALLLLQAAAGGAVTLAEAREPLTAESHVEAGHEPGCPVLHDVQRCALCHYTVTRVVIQQTLAPAVSGRERRVAPPVEAVPTVAAGARFTVHSRAPPVLLS